MDFFWNLTQDASIAANAKDLTRASRSVAANTDEVEALTRQVDRLTLACQAMWEIIRATGAVTDEHLLAKMQEIDLRDGKEDGKISRTVVTCPKCQRASNSRRDKCMYCGTEFQRPHVFEG
jgi:hypothetical protein